VSGVGDSPLSRGDYRMSNISPESHDEMLGCERFAGTPSLREICEGRRLDLTLDRINEYRQRWRLPPLKEDEVPPRQIPVKSRSIHKSGATPQRRSSNGEKPCTGCGGGKKQTQRTPRLNGYGPGSKLLEDFSRAGAPHCEECLELAAKMDAWGKQGCEEHLDEIVEEILPRAQEWMEENRPWVRKFLRASLTEGIALKIGVRRKVQAAIRKADSPNNKRHRKKKSKRRARGSVTVDRKGFPSGMHWARSFQPTNGTPDFITTDQLTTDTLSLIPKLPPDVTMVVGSARSGLIPASLVAMMLHLPMTIVRNRLGDFVPAGHGWRMQQGAPKKQGKILVIDDTTMTGNSLLRMKQVLEDMPGEKIWASVYCNPAAVNKPDLWAVDLPWPHLLEWNLFNSVLLDSFALDFDGILCEDCLPADDDDGPRYEEFLQATRPLYLVRKKAISLIVTARLEKYRPQTMAWMDRWGISAKKLVMGPWEDIQDRRRSDVAEWKAKSLERFLSKRDRIAPKFYIESAPKQAERIAELTGRLVVCPSAKRCFGKAKR